MDNQNEKGELLVVNHASVLQSLVDSPKYKRELADELDVSKSTVYNIHTRLASAGLMTKRGGKYALTGNGRMSLLAYRGFESQIEMINSSEDEHIEPATSRR